MLRFHVLVQLLEIAVAAGTDAFCHAILDTSHNAPRSIQLPLSGFDFFPGLIVRGSLTGQPGLGLGSKSIRFLNRSLAHKPLRFATHWTIEGFVI